MPHLEQSLWTSKFERMIHDNQRPAAGIGGERTESMSNGLDNDTGASFQLGMNLAPRLLASTAAVLRLTRRSMAASEQRGISAPHFALFSSLQAILATETPSQMKPAIDARGRGHHS